MILKFRFSSFVLRRPIDGDGESSGGGFQEAAPDVIDQTPVDGGQQPAPTDADRNNAAMEAIFGKPAETKPAETAEESAAAARARDELGRFAQKPPADPTKPAAPVAPDAAKKPPVDPAKDLTVMPEGLSPKGQERFQALANANKELTAKLDAVMTATGGDLDVIAPAIQNYQALQQTFQENGVTRQQFDQSVQFLGMVNRGDLSGAQKLLEDQLRLISMATGKPIGAVDALSDFPDLRQRVDNLQLTEEDALQLARTRAYQATQQQTQQRQQQEQQYAQQEQQAVQQGQLAVDKFCKAQMASDLDYPKIEPLLLKEIQDGLLANVPPAAWAQIIQKTYGLIKQSASMSRATMAGSSSSGGVLRPSGSGGGKSAPKDGFEAMWGARSA